MFETLISFSLASFVLALSPGPDNIFVLAQSLAHGSKSGIAVTAGLVSGCIVHTTLLAFGISAIITASETAFYFIKIIGAAYLLYLAFRVYKSDSKIAITDVAPEKTFKQLFQTGVIMNLVNPKVMIFFLAFFPGFLWNTEENTVIQFFILGAVFMAISFIVFSGVALLAGNISQILQKSRNIFVVLKWLQIVVFVGIAVFIVFAR